jgi:GNAT superfamily N-acetyltransferase
VNVLPVLDIEPSEIVKLWNESIGKTFPMSEDLWIQNTINEPNILKTASIAILEGNELLGFIVAKRYQESLQASMPSHIGWIQCILVKESARNQGIGSWLLQHAERNLQEEQMTEIRLGRDPWHYFPGVPADDKHAIEWFANRGYIKESIETDLARLVKDAPLYALKNSVDHFRVLTQKDLPDLLQFLEHVFPGRWHYEAIHYSFKEGSGREFMGFFINDELQGFCRMNDSQSPLIAQNVYWSGLFEGELGGIGPLGIDRSIRGSHYGLDLVKSAANELMRRKVSNIVIDWTQLVPFYEKLGFTAWKQYQTMGKAVSIQKGGEHD